MAASPKTSRSQRWARSFSPRTQRSQRTKLALVGWAASRAANFLAVILAVAAVASGASTVQSRERAIQERAIGETKVYAEVPNPPGNPEGLAIRGDTLFIGTHTPAAGN